MLTIATHDCAPCVAGNTLACRALAAVLDCAALALEQVLHHEAVSLLRAAHAQRRRAAHEAVLPPVEAAHHLQCSEPPVGPVAVLQPLRH